MKTVLVLGAGMVGSVIARDLAARYQVTVLDRSRESLSRLDPFKEIQTQVADIDIPGPWEELLTKTSLVVNALPGSLGFSALRRLVSAGCTAVDIAFSPEDVLDLEEEAKKTGARIAVDCGVAPGMGNLLLGYHDSQMKVESYECYVGGLPLRRTLPFQYKAPFSPADVIEEYTRPARYLVNGTVVTKPALSDPEFLNFDGIGTLEAFNTDGLRSMLRMTHIPNMVEKTLRYPGHRALMEALRDAGMFSTDPVDLNGNSFVPRDVTAAMLFRAWKLREGEDEFTVMRIRITGEEKGRLVTHQYDLHDSTDHVRGMSSMARTTGFTCTALCSWMLDQHTLEPGIHPPERFGGEEALTRFILDYLADRGVVYEHVLL